MKRLSPLIPEIYLILALCAYWLFSGTLLNPIAFVLIIALVFQIIVKNLYTGLIIAAILAVLNFYLFIALFSELRKFPGFNAEAKQMLWTGTVYFGANLLMSIWMAINYMKIKSSRSRPGL